LGGVLIGRFTASEEANATRSAPIVGSITAIDVVIGMCKLEAEVRLMKFDINIENIAVGEIAPSNTIFGFVLKGLINALASVRSRLRLLAAMAKIKPPKNRTRTGLAKGLKKIEDRLGIRIML